ncbi:hypothetical protein MGYG_08632 [Nannizzia gypsea CBS 118893]|uniref:Transcriptional regulatory protein RXT2 N-terminal domain-containing protein n=1 Tax=Arthroderma gypseum (strain ATCC MYA-4604 / CBS 118893) TaxID=535722 RepID=E4V6J2_ARTGP|nr:hypothetical protein MGYG_08632 [Nannizzia gypsea CBS 118893]EFQ96708.1 hypothetical protein MGYG_08632 [Nannizzia gypsea CBS 118893]
MASQAALIDETIVGLKRALLRHASDAAYDDAINQPSNRGNKTRLNAEFVREGALGCMNHERFYRKKAEHSGYTRDILESNPPRYDAEGDELDFDDSDAAADAEAADDNPFSSTRLDDLLAPLTHPSELANHSMANAYTNKAITTMIERINRRLRLERHALWQAKNVYRQLVTDSIWMPCGAVERDDDAELFGAPTPHSMAQEPSGSNPTATNSSDRMNVDQHSDINGDISTSKDRKNDDKKVDQPDQPPDNSHDPDGDAIMESADANERESNDRKGGGGEPEGDQAESGSPKDKDKDKEMTDDGFLHPRRMTTRAQVSANQNTASQEKQNEKENEALSLEVDPIFRLPRMPLEEQNCGLTQSEADETRRMLWAYIQKQGESVRLFTEMLKMLRKSHRMKEEVWEWCKAEAHIGEMSDGEDWYDKERWGLGEGEDLRKGADEEETEGLDEGRPTGKRGRGRRT